MLNPTLPYLNLDYQTVTNSREAYLGATQELHSGDFHSQSAGEEASRLFAKKKPVTENNLTACQNISGLGKVILQ